MAHNTMIKTYVDHDNQIQFLNNNVRIGQPNIAKNFIISDGTIRFISDGVLHIVQIKKPSYIIDGTTMVFLHDFNEPLDAYDKILKHITVLIFEERHGSHFQSVFNHPVTITKKMLKLSLGDSFTKPIVLTKNMTHVFFGNKFFHQLFITKNICVLSFGRDFNRPVVLTKNIRVLSFGYFYRDPIILGKHLKHLTLGPPFRKSFVPNKNLRHLTMTTMTEQNFLLEQITHLTIGYFGYHVQDKLSNDIKELDFGYNTTVPMYNIPNSIKRIPIESCSYVYDHLLDRIIPCSTPNTQYKYIDV